MSSNNQIPYRILVLGAGELGTEVIRFLIQRASKSTGNPSSNDNDVTVSVMLRPQTLSQTPPASQVTLLRAISPSLNFISADLASISVPDLAAILRQYDTVVSCTGFGAGPAIQLKIAEAALQGKVKRFFPWQFGVDYDVIGKGSVMPLFDVQLEVRDLLRNQRDAEHHTDWVIVSTGIFTSFIFEPSFGVVEVRQQSSSGEGKEVVVHALGGWENRVTATVPEDIGRMTAEIVFDTRISNQIVHVAGDTISYGSLADSIESALQKKHSEIALRREEWPVPMLEQENKRDPENQIKRYRVLFAQGRGVAWDIESSFNHKQGVKLSTVEDWIDANLDNVLKG